MMATCNDCVHNNICNITQIDYQPKRTIQHIEEYCGQFKDLLRLVYLPCKVGDSYFEIEQYCTERGYYTEPRHTDTVDCEYCDVDGVCDRQYRITEKRFVSLIQIFEYKEKAADKYNRKFLTKEEAKQALAKRNQPDNTPQ